MSINLVRVINQQTLVRSILIDKIDRCQGNFSGYANRAKQKVYVPYANPVDSTVKGYIDLVPTDEVLLSADAGTIKKLKDAGKVDFAIVASNLVATPVVTAASDGGTDITVDGTTFTSVSPDKTYLIVTNGSGVSLKVPSTSFGSFTGTQIVVADATVAALGTPAAGWKVQVQANSKLSNVFTI
jgi:hypothetical protein